MRLAFSYFFVIVQWKTFPKEFTYIEPSPGGIISPVVVMGPVKVGNAPPVSAMVIVTGMGLPELEGVDRAPVLLLAFVSSWLCATVLSCDDFIASFLQELSVKNVNVIAVKKKIFIVISFIINRFLLGLCFCCQQLLAVGFMNFVSYNGNIPIGINLNIKIIFPY